MWNILKKWNLEIYSVIMIAFAVITFINWNTTSYAKQLVSVFMLLTVLHEWEETRYPGGFFDIFLAKLDEERRAKIDLGYIHFMVVIMLLVDLVPGYFLEGIRILTMIPITFGILEAIMHTAGIFINHMGKPYTPGLISAIFMLIAAVIFLKKGFELNMIASLDIILGAVIMILVYAIIQSAALRKYGLTMRDIH